MALSATATQGIEFHRSFRQGETVLIPGDPGDTYTKGDLITVTVGEGVADPAAASEVVLARVAKTVVCAAATVGMQKPADVDRGAASLSDEDKTLVEVEFMLQDGCPIFRSTFSDHFDESTLASFSNNGASTYLEMDTGAGADDRPNGGLVYAYDGTGAGQANIVSDYDHTGGAVELLLQTHRQFKTALDTTTDIILLAGEAAASRGTGGPGSRVDAKDQNNLDVSDGANDGDFLCYYSWEEIPDTIAELKLQVVPVGALLMV